MVRFKGGIAGLALVLFVIGVSEAAAQRPLRVGVIGGVNMSGVYGDDAEATDTRIGYDVGGLVQIPMGSMITIQPEVHFTQKGFTARTIAGSEAEEALSYIQVPILLRAGVPLAEGFDVDFLFGPSLGFLMSCEESVEGSPSEFDCKDEVASFDWGIIGGGGFSWAAGAGDVLVDIRYDLGLKEVFDIDSPPDVKNTNAQLLLGYAFPL